MAETEPRDSAASRLTRAVIIGGALLILGLNLPGHLSYDSVAQLQEGRVGQRSTWGPAFYAWILGAGDRILPGTGLYVAASTLLLCAALLLLLRLRPRTSWLAVPVAGVMMLTPQLLIYQGIVWKDVLFANCALAGFVLIAAASCGLLRGWRSGALLLAALLFAVGALVRQNGAIVIPFAALALGCALRERGWRRAGALALGWLLVAFALIKVIGWSVEPTTDGPDISINLGVRIIEHYDLAGVVAQDKAVKLDVLAGADKKFAAIVREMANHYSPERVDTLADGANFEGLWQAPDAVVGRQWLNAVMHEPTAYLRHRAAVFGWLMAPPEPARCLPVHVGVSATSSLLARLGMANEIEQRDWALLSYVERLQDTPIYRHANYVILAALLLAIVLSRRDAADWAVAALLASALAFTATFFVISIACDYRYLYFLDLATMAGLLYVAADPPRLRIGKGGAR